MTILTAQARDAASKAAQEKTGHAVFAPSASARWLDCPASVQACLRTNFDTISDEYEAADSGDSFYSVEGTKAHEIAEFILYGLTDGREYIGDEYGTPTRKAVVDETMIGFVTDYVRWCGDRGPGLVREIEERVDLSAWMPIPNQGGTADFVHYSAIDHTLTIGDLKFGTGVKVFAEENTQLMLYSLGVFHELRRKGHRVQRIVVAIIQPRLDHFDEWEFTPERLARFEKHVVKQAADAWSDNPTFNPTPKACRFCPVRANCRALAKHMTEMVDSVFDDLDSDSGFDPVDFSSAHLSKLLKWKRTIYSAVSAAERELTQRMREGEAVEGWKLVQGRGTRQWSKPAHEVREIVEEIFGVPADDLMDHTMKSPKAVEDMISSRRLGKRSALKALIRATDGPVTIAPAWDERLDLGSIPDAFDNLDDPDL